jgi:GxxExxY protein
MQHKEITHAIIGCAIRVHNALGNGFPEIIYQRALAIELTKDGLQYARELEMKIFYGGVHVGTRRVDFFVDGKMLVELKAVIKLDDSHLAQAINYCRAFNLQSGLLINFGSRRLEFKRAFNLNYRE